MRDELARFIQDNLVHTPGEAIGPDDSLIDRGLLDSIGLMQIMQFVEERASVRIPDYMVTPDNFQSITAIEQMVQGIRTRS